jgi:multidrug efflux pump subunit AcrA (membrane-fusion protein)
VQFNYAIILNILALQTMKERIKNFLRSLKRPKRAIITIVILIIVFIVGSKLFGSKKAPYQTQTVARGNVVQQVEVTGNVKSSEAVDLGFELG